MFRTRPPPVLLAAPLSTLAGTNRERKKAGYDPDSNPMSIVPEIVVSQNDGLLNGTEMCFPARRLNNGNASNAMIMHTANAISEIMEDSVRNCLIRLNLS